MMKPHEWQSLFAGCLNRKDFQAAAALLARVKPYAGESAPWYYACGKLAQELEEWEKAEQAFARALSMHECRQYRFAYVFARKSRVRRPQDLQAVLRGYDELLCRYPDDWAALHNRSEVLRGLGLYDLALRDADSCLNLAPDFALGYCNRSFILNALGRYPEGWRDYEWRWQTGRSEFMPKKWPLPAWKGQDVGRDRVLVYAEQGLGDNIQFVRYAIEAKRRGMNIVVVNHVPTEKLLNANLARYGIATAANGSSISGLKYHVSMMSLPHYFGTIVDSVPCPTAYIQAQPEYAEQWRARLGQSGRNKYGKRKKRVGIVWSGSMRHNRNFFRSVSFPVFAQLFEEDVWFHCLQKEILPEDEALCGRYRNVFCHHYDLADFSDTAGLIEQMDLVVSVDTAVAHLAAAMGKPTWILLPCRPDFRWLLYRNDSPWYRSARLFRQDNDWNWQPVMMQVRQALHQFAP